MSTTGTWRKSSYSGNANDCVELAVGTACTSIRDSKNHQGGQLTFDSSAFRSFLESIKAEQLNTRA